MLNKFKRLHRGAAVSGIAIGGRTRTWLALVTGFLLVFGLMATSSPAASAGTERSKPDGLAMVRGATARYHSVTTAERDGYLPITGCISNGAGAMGVHYANAKLMADGVLDPERPEILLYVPKGNGEGEGLRLVGVEYWSPDGDQNLATTEDRPVLFERPFSGPMPGHIPGMAVHYDLHVWVWKANPAGLFESYNTALRCPAAAPSDRH